MKKIIFTFILLFFLLGVNTTFSYISSGDIFFINGVSYRFSSGYGEVPDSSEGSVYGTYLISSDGEQKFFPVQISVLRFDYGSGEYYFKDGDSSYYYIKNNLELEKLNLGYVGSSCSNEFSFHNRKFYCDIGFFRDFTVLPNIHVFGRSSYYKTLEDEPGVNIKFRFSNDSLLRDLSLFIDNFNYYNHIVQVGINSILVIEQNNEDNTISTFLYDSLSGESVSNLEKLPYKPGDDFRIIYYYNGTYRLDVGSNSKYGKIDKKFLGTIDPGKSLPNEGLSGTFTGITTRTNSEQGESLTCFEFVSNKVPTCGEGQYLKINSFDDPKPGDVLTCESFKPSKEPKNFVVNDFKTFSFYKDSVSYPMCGFFKFYDIGDSSNEVPGKNNENSPIDSNDKNNSDNNSFLGSIKNAINAGLSKVTTALASIKSAIESGLGALKDSINAGLSKVTTALASIKNAIESGFGALKDGLLSILSGIGESIGAGFDKIASLFGDFSGVNLESNGLNYENIGNINTNGEGFLNIKSGKINDPILESGTSFFSRPYIKDGMKCKIFNENNLTFLYYSNGNSSINFTLKQFGFLDNQFGGFLDFISGIFIGPLNNIIGIIGVVTPFSSDYQQVCLFGEVKTIEFHKMMKGTEYYGKMTMFDYLVIFTFGSFIFFIIGGISFFKGISTPEGRITPYKYTPYSQGGYIVNDKMKK